MLGEVIAAIASKFVTLQAENPFLAIEALLRFTHPDMINKAMNNYFINEQTNNFNARDLNNIKDFNFD